MSFGITDRDKKRVLVVVENWIRGVGGWQAVENRFLLGAQCIQIQCFATVATAITAPNSHTNFVCSLRRLFVKRSLVDISEATAQSHSAIMSGIGWINIISSSPLKYKFFRNY